MECAVHCAKYQSLLCTGKSMLASCTAGGCRYSSFVMFLARCSSDHVVAN